MEKEDGMGWERILIGYITKNCDETVCDGFIDRLYSNQAVQTLLMGQLVDGFGYVFHLFPQSLSQIFPVGNNLWGGYQEVF